MNAPGPLSVCSLLLTPSPQVTSPEAVPRVPAHYVLTDSPSEHCYRRSEYVLVVSRPVRRILSRRLTAPEAAIPLGRRLPAGSSGLPGGVYGRAVLPLRGLAPGGVCRATRVAPGAGALLPHRFTLTCAGPLRRPVPPSAVCSLWHFPAGRPDWVLPSTVPGGVRTFLGPVRRSARHAAARPTRHHPHCRAQPVGLPWESSVRARRRDAR